MTDLCCCFSVLQIFVSCTVKVVPGGELYGATFLLVWKMPFINLSINYVERKMGISKFLSASSMTRMWLSSTRMCNTIGPTTSTLWSFPLFSCGTQLTQIDGNKLRSTGSSWSRLSPARVSKTQLVGHMRDEVKSNLTATLSFLFVNKMMLKVLLKL